MNSDTYINIFMQKNCHAKTNPEFCRISGIRTRRFPVKSLSCAVCNPNLDPTLIPVDLIKNKKRCLMPKICINKTFARFKLLILA